MREEDIVKLSLDEDKFNIILLLEEENVTKNVRKIIFLLIELISQKRFYYTSLCIKDKLNNSYIAGSFYLKVSII